MGESGLLAQAARTDDLASRFDALAASVRPLELRVAELSALLKAVLPPSSISEVSPPVDLNVESAPARGSADGKVALIE